MSDERRWGDRDRDWRNDRDRNDYGERNRQEERSFGGERYGEYDQGRRYGGRMDYDAGNPGRFGRESWGGGQSYGSGDWPNYASDYDYRRDYRGGGSDYGDSPRSYGQGSGRMRSEGSYGSDYGRGSAGMRSEGSYGSDNRGGYGSGAYRSSYGSGAYGSSSGSGMSYGYGRDERAGARDYRGDYGRRDYRGSQSSDDRNWFDKAGDEVQSWFGDRDAERRRQQDHIREGDHRGRGPSGYRRSDERIREDVNDRLSDDSWLDASSIDVHVHEGEVTLNGTVHDRHDKRHAEDLAERISGVHHVQNNLRCKTTSHGLATSQAQTGTAATGSAAGTSASNLTGSTSSTGSTASQPRTSKETL